MRARDFLIRGLLAGLIAAFAAFGVAYVVGEPSVRAAIALEDSAGGHSHGAETAGSTDAEHAEPDAPAAGEVEVPRSLQSTLGLLTGLLVAGVTLGGLVGVVSAMAMGRFGRLTPRATTLAVTAMAFVAVYVVPFLIYPPNPPAVGSGDTIGMRSALYFIFLAISLIAAVTAVLVGRRLRERVGGWHAALIGIAGYVRRDAGGDGPAAALQRGAGHVPGLGAVRLPPGQLPDPAHALDGARGGAGRVRRAAVRQDLAGARARRRPRLTAGAHR